MKKYTREQTLQATLDYFDGDELAADVFVEKYALSDDTTYFELTPDDMHHRMARELARMEKKYPNAMSENEIYELFKDFKYIVPQGSPMSAIGNPHQIESTSNCFVIESPWDSYGGILKTDQELVQIAKRRGGIGFDISTIRPRGEKTTNAAKTTDGIGIFMQRWSNSTEEVAQNGRRGALMLSISIHHPEIRTFIRIKNQKVKCQKCGHEHRNQITGANCSIRISDEFMNAVQEGTDYQLRWPVDSEEPQITEMIDARALWDDIIDNAWAAAEPGLLFWDNAKKYSPADIYEDEGFGSTSTNPCGEIILSPYDSCRLMCVNLKSFVHDPFTKDARFDYDHYATVVQQAQRLMDDLIDLEIEHVDKIIKKVKSDPEPDFVKFYELNLWQRVREACEMGRRTGLGITAMGDALAALGMRYGSAASIEVAEKIYKTLAVNSYTSSIILAKERGAFPVFDVDKEMGHPFIERIKNEIDAETLNMYYKYGRRNIANTTTAPTGSVSCMTKTTSGIEPVPFLAYERKRKLTDGEEIPENKVEIDDKGVKWVKYDVYHHGLQEWMDVSGLTDVEASPYWKATCVDIDWLSKVRLQASAQKWVCHAISNTTNLPEDVSKEVVDALYREGHKLGCKGMTIYRQGSRPGVLVQKDSNGALYEIVLEDGSILNAKLDDVIEYDGQTLSVSQLCDHIKAA